MMAKVREEKERVRIIQERLTQKESERQKVELKLMMVEDMLSTAADVDRMERGRQVRKKREGGAPRSSKKTSLRPTLWNLSPCPQVRNTDPPKKPSTDFFLTRER